MSQALSSTSKAAGAILDGWLPGDAVFSFQLGLVWVFSAPRRVRAKTLPGAALVWLRDGKLLSSAPLSDREQQTLLAPGNQSGKHLVLVAGGVMHVIPWEELVVEAPSTWLDTSDWKPVALTTLAASPQYPAVAVKPEWRSARNVLGVPKPSPDQFEFLDNSFRKHKTGRDRGQAGAVSWLAAIYRVALLLMGLLVQVGGVPRSKGESSPSNESLPLARSRPDQSWWRSLHAWVANQIAASHIGWLIGRRQARYLARMLQAFEQGDIDEALRLAVPIAADGSPSKGPNIPLLGSFVRREDLWLDEGASSGNERSVVLPDEVIDMLRRTYRTALTRLVRAGRIEEAAFVLFDLLHSEEEGLNLLVEHGQTKRAARIAETRNMASELVVSLWFLAGNQKRAVAIARRDSAFTGAVVRLSRKNPALADQLRALWAKDLAARGDFLNAVVKASSDPSMSRLVESWTELGIAAGGPSSLRLRIMRLRRHAQDQHQLDSANSDDYSVLLRAFTERSPDGAATRAEFSRELLQIYLKSPELRVLQTRMAREIMRDFQTRGAQKSGRYITLPKHMGLGRHNRAWRADLPENWRDAMNDDVNTPVNMTVPGDLHGAAPILDALRMPNRDVLAALGDLGCVVLSPKGNVVSFMPTPTDALVSIPGGTSALGVRVLGAGPRDNHILVHRIDVRRGITTTLGAFPSNLWSRTSDGATWFLAVDEVSLLMIDLLADSPSALWHAELGEIRHVSVGPQRVNVCTSTGVWSYERNNMTLRNRDLAGEIPVEDRLSVLAMVSGAEFWHALRVRIAQPEVAPTDISDRLADTVIEPIQDLESPAAARLVWELSRHDGTSVVSQDIAPLHDLVEAVPGEDDWALVERTPGETPRGDSLVSFYRWKDTDPAATVRLPGVAHCTVRFEGRVAVIGDSLGRVTTVHLANMSLGTTSTMSLDINRRNRRKSQVSR